MPRSVIDIDAINNLNPKMGKLTLPMKKINKKIKTAQQSRVGKVADKVMMVYDTKPIQKKIKKTTKKAIKSGKKKIM
tara:strand:- start:681 stop:911 length:231 start_codon:yes stop_codon:yes gene_type:complete